MGSDAYGGIDQVLGTGPTIGPSVAEILESHAGGTGSPVKTAARVAAGRPFREVRQDRLGDQR